jgi:hypothetical protein
VRGGLTRPRDGYLVLCLNLNDYIDEMDANRLVYLFFLIVSRFLTLETFWCRAYID